MSEPTYTVALSHDQADEITAILRREMAGHHNRMTSYLTGDMVAVSVERATECALAAQQVGRLITAVNRQVEA